MFEANNVPEIQEEDVKEFPQQTTFNVDDMSVIENDEMEDE